MNQAQHLIEQLALEPHPEGGFYKRIYESPNTIQAAQGQRLLTTSIHYLLEENDFSAWHKIKSDELWYFHQGCTLLIHTLQNTGRLQTEELSTAKPFIKVPANTWFSAELTTEEQNENSQAFSLVSCVVSPGFDFEDFEMAYAEDLVSIYPQHRDIICRLCRQ